MRAGIGRTTLFRIWNDFVESGIDITGKAKKLNGKIASNLSLTLLLKSEGQNPVFKIGAIEFRTGASKAAQSGFDAESKTTRIET